MHSDVFQQISHDLRCSTDDFMTLRSVSRHWRWLTDQQDSREVQIPATTDNLTTKIAALHSWRGAGTFSACSCNFQLTSPVFVCKAASLLERLTIQVRRIVINEGSALLFDQV